MKLNDIKGFTLIEALIAVLILSIGIVAVMLGFPRGLQSLEDSEQLTRQSFYLYSTLERVHAICIENQSNADTLNFQNIIGDNPRDPWNTADLNYVLRITNRSGDRTVDVEVTNLESNVSIFGSLTYP